jgi:methylated-DNA-protein-cysteine methyltransferase-like protein
VKQPPGWTRYYRIVSRIPRGKVSTYGDVARVAGRPRGAREVGYALAALRGAVHAVPWQRVLGKRPGDFAGISLLDPVGAAAQRDLLEREGVAFDERDRVSLASFGWRPGRRRSPTPAAWGRRSRSPRRTGGSSGRS